MSILIDGKIEIFDPFFESFLLSFFHHIQASYKHIFRLVVSMEQKMCNINSLGKGLVKERL